MKQELVPVRLPWSLLNVVREFGGEVSELKNLGRISSSGLESLLRSYASPQWNRGVSRCSGHRSWIAPFPFSPTPEIGSRTVSLPLEPCFARRSLDGPSNSHCRLLANPGTRSGRCKRDPCNSLRPFSCHPMTQYACGLPNTRGCPCGGIRRRFQLAVRTPLRRTTRCAPGVHHSCPSNARYWR